jgi:uncharacterized protein (TIGR02246 family)
MAAATPELISVEFGIRQLQARCADAVWRKDTQAFATCFTPDGVWKVAGLTIQGREAIVSGFEMLTSVNERILMQFATPIVELTGTLASARTYTAEHVKRLDGTGMSSIGIYYEKFMQTAGEWLYTWRHFDFCYFGPGDLSADLYAFVDYGPPPALPASDAATAGMQAN